MAKFCPNCGNEVSEGINFCNHCGASLNNNSNSNNLSTSSPIITERNIALAIVLSFVTCGIYAIYWFIMINDEVNSLSDDKGPSSGMVILLSIITCGIYAFYWNYKVGQRLYGAGKKYNKEITDNSVLYLVLMLFGLGIVNYCLIQSDLNKFSK